MSPTNIDSRMFSCVLANVSLVRCWVVFLGGGKAKKKVKILGCRKDTNGHRCYGENLGELHCVARDHGFCMILC